MELLGRERELRVRHVDGDPRQKPAGHAEVAAVVDARRIDLKRNPEVGRGVEFGVEAARHDADHSVRNAAERNTLSDDRAVAAEAPLPQSIAKNNHMRAVGPILIHGKRAACDDRCAEQAKVIGGGMHGVNGFRIWAASEAQGNAIEFVSSDILKGLGLRSQHVVARGRAAIIGAVGRGDKEPDDAISIGEGERLEQNGVDHGENRRGGPDAERERRDGGDGEPRAANQSPQGMLQFLQDLLHVLTDAAFTFE